MAVSGLIVTWLVTLGLDWPTLPWQARLSDVLFVPAALAVWLSAGRRLRASAMDLVVVTYIGGSAVGVMASPDRMASLAELSRHGYLAVIYATVATAVVRGYLPAVRQGLIGMGLVLAAPALVAAVLFVIAPHQAPAMGEVMTLPYLGSVLRLDGATASPTMFACLLTVALPFALAERARADRTLKRGWTVVCAVLIGALVLTFSHAWAGAALATAICVWPVLVHRPTWRLAALGSVCVLTLLFNASLVAAVIDVTPRGDPRPATDPSFHHAVDIGQIELSGYTVDYAVMSYFRIKQLAWAAFVEHPMSGVGLNRFHEVTETAFQQGQLPSIYRAIDPHSAVLGRLAETGILGGVTLLCCWMVVILRGSRVLRQSQSASSGSARAALAAVAGLLLAGLNVDIMNFRFLWVAFGVIRGLEDEAG